MTATLGAIAFDPEQLRAIEATASPLAIVGPPGAGKTLALAARALRLASATTPADAPVLATAASDAGVARFGRVLALLDGHAADAVQPGIVVRSLGDAALTLLRVARPGVTFELISDARASLRFEECAASLVGLTWTEFLDDAIDPEVTGLRSPERFLAAAFRLIRKLRAALVTPEAFRRKGLAGAVDFYGAPPNFANTDLLQATQPKYRDSLRVDAAELERQRRREIDLVKILARLYDDYVTTLVACGTLTATDAVYEAALAIACDPAVAALAARSYRAVLADDAQDATAGQLALLDGFSAAAAPLALAGDPAQTTRQFGIGARGADRLRRGEIVALRGDHRGAGTFVSLASRIVPSDDRATIARAPMPEPRGALRRYRAESLRDEAAYVAAEAAAAIAAGTPTGRIAVVTRDISVARGIVDALLARGVPVDVGGAGSLYDYPVVGDALAALRSAIDPFRHDALLRTLQGPWLALADATLGALCAQSGAEPPALFTLPADVEPAGGRRWDRNRDLRLGRNATRGDADAELPAEARERLATYRAARARWQAAARELAPPGFARLVLDETVLACLDDGPRGRFERGLVARLLAEIDAFFEREPLEPLDAFLDETDRLAATEGDLLEIERIDADALAILDVEAAKGETFDVVFAPDLRAGAWPKYYTPEAFLFHPKYGIIPKENVGDDARAARTAKFTYLLHVMAIRDKYNSEERRALYVALTRATTRAHASASGRPTRGRAAPELLEELRDDS